MGTPERKRVLFPDGSTFRACPILKNNHRNRQTRRIMQRRAAERQERLVDPALVLFNERP